VYQCLLADDSDHSFDVCPSAIHSISKVDFCSQESPIFQLQTTFAALQESRKKIFNPEKLVGSLQLRTNEQQDAQECVILMFTIDRQLIAHIDFPSYSSPTWTMNSRSNLILL
jgi:hypothetical protein